MYCWSKKFIYGAAVAVCLIVCAGVAQAGLKPVFNGMERHMEKVLAGDRIYPGVFAGGADLGGLTKAEAEARLTEAFMTPLYEKHIRFTDGQTEIVCSLPELGTFYSVALAAESAYAWGRIGGFKQRYRAVSALNDEPVDVGVPYSVDPAVMDAAITKIANTCEKAPTDAALTLKAGKFAVSGENNGRRLDMDALMAALMPLVENGDGGTVHLSFETVPPRFTAAELMKKATSLLGSYETPLEASDPNRLQNVKLAASRINGVVVMPGEVFSVAAHIKPNDSAYLPAGTYLQGKVVDAVGGGVCQAVSTLYVALLYSELDIVERQNHSMPVSYMDYGFDATMAEGLIDLKFKNNTAYPVTLESNVSGNKLWVNVYGQETRPAERRLAFENELVTTVRPEAELITWDPSLTARERVVEVPERNGYTFRLYKLIYMNGELADRVLVNTSVYAPVRGQVRVGAN